METTRQVAGSCNPQAKGIKTPLGLYGDATMGHPIQIILARQLAAYLSVPFFLVDPNGRLLFYNEAAEAILGRRFDESGAMPLDEWWSTFSRFDDQGKLVERKDHPLMITLAENRPAYKCYRIRRADDVVRRIEATAIPITGLQGELLGAVALFWECPE
jgi:PAS domain-containing protein